MKQCNIDIDKVITQAKAGDKDSIFIIIQYFAPYIYKIIRNFNIQGTDINDLYQTSCIAIMKAIDKYQSNLNTFKSYVYRSILNEICCLARNNKKHNNCVSYNTLNPIFDSHSDYSDILLIDDSNFIDQYFKNEDISLLYQCIAELSNEDRHLILNVYFNNMSFTEYAKKNNIPYNKVIRKKNNILAELHKKIKQAED